MGLNPNVRRRHDNLVMRWRRIREANKGVIGWEQSDLLALDDYLAACEALLREIGAYCAPIAPGLDPVGKALYERIGPLLMVEE